MARAEKVYFPEDGTVDSSRISAATAPSSRSKTRCLRPGRTSCASLAGKAASRRTSRCRASAQHAARTQHPDFVAANAFGDRYVYSLCPSAPEARAYAIGLARDVTESYPVSGVSLETPGFLPYAHGYHHEFALNRPNRWLDSQLGLCFCGEHCRAGAKSAGIRVEALKRQVEADIEAYLASDVDFPSDMRKRSGLRTCAATATSGPISTWRCSVVTSLVREIRDAVRKDANVAVIPSVARPSGGAWY